MKTVLLIEDDAKLALAYGVRLKAIGYTVHIARDAISAVAHARKTNPDVILLDISLPGGDGFLVAERLSKMISSAATPIIFITASKRADLRERAMELGAAGFLEKPFDATALADAIETALSPNQNWAPEFK